MKTDKLNISMAYTKKIDEFRLNFGIVRDNFASVALGLAEAVNMLDELESRFNAMFPSQKHEKTYKETKYGRQEV